MRFALFLVLVCSSFINNGQDLHYARNTIDLLASPALQGRGYVKDGHILAAEYIASEFAHFGLQSFRVDYLQPFPLNVNTFPGKMVMKVDGQKLIPGQDFLVHPSSPGIRGSFNILRLHIDSLLINTPKWIAAIKKSHEVIALDKSGYDQLSTEDKLVIDGLIEVLLFNSQLLIKAVIIISNDKLIWGTSATVGVRPLLEVKRDRLENPIPQKVKFNIRNEWLEDKLSYNVIGLIPGARSDSVIVITAHYDHLGLLGKKTYFPGANDNASGVALLLDLARKFSFSEKPDYGLLFIAFGGEEAGLLGSQYYVNLPVYPLDKIKFLINLDIVGTGDEGITVVNGSVFTDQYDSIVAINKTFDLIPEIKPRGSACNSDHCPFYNQDIPCFYIYTRGGIQAYHDIFDRPETLPLTEYDDLSRLLAEFIRNLNKGDRE